MRTRKKEEKYGRTSTGPVLSAHGKSVSSQCLSAQSPSPALRSQSTPPNFPCTLAPLGKGVQPASTGAACPSFVQRLPSIVWVSKGFPGGCCIASTWECTLRRMSQRMGKVEQVMRIRKSRIPRQRREGGRGRTRRKSTT